MKRFIKGFVEVESLSPFDTKVEDILFLSIDQRGLLKNSYRDLFYLRFISTIGNIYDNRVKKFYKAN